MRLLILICCIALVVTGCGGDPQAASETPVTPSAAPLSGAVDIEFPPDGAVIFAETLHLAGTSDGVETFVIQLVDVNEAVIAESTITPDSDGRWRTEVVHGYTGEPTEVNIMALPADDDTRDYDIATIVLTDISNRPQGVFGAIFSPFDGATVGGDTIEVTGTASGLFEGTMQLELTDEDGIVISTMVVTVFNPNLIDEIPWTADLPTSGYQGEATIRAYSVDMADGSEDLIGQVTITITDAAG